MKGYFFSLESLIAILVILSSVILINFNIVDIDSREEKIYSCLELLERKNSLREATSQEIESQMEEILDFDIEVEICTRDCGGSGSFIDYLVYEEEGKIVRIFY